MKQDMPYQGLVLITDLDGTLLLPDKRLSAADAEAIADFRAKGGLFGIATGRGLQAAKEYLALLQPDFPAILYNGVMLYDPDAEEVRMSSRLPATVNALLEDLMVRFPDAGVELLNEEGVYVIQDGEYERMHLRITKITPVFRTLKECPAELCCKSLCAAAEDVIDQMLAYVGRLGLTDIMITKSNPHFLEILPQGVSKGSALAELRKLLPEGVKIGASGDFDNDILMLKAADYAGCPADSQPSVLEAIAEVGGYCSEKTCADGFFADWKEEACARYQNAAEVSG